MVIQDRGGFGLLTKRLTMIAKQKGTVERDWTYGLNIGYATPNGRQAGSQSNEG